VKPEALLRVLLLSWQSQGWNYYLYKGIAKLKKTTTKNCKESSDKLCRSSNKMLDVDCGIARKKTVYNPF
jgi:hypothetical protein